MLYWNQSPVEITSFYLVVIYIVYSLSNAYNTNSITISTDDRWRVILKDEQPDYIHAVNISVCFIAKGISSEPIA